MTQEQADERYMEIARIWAKNSRAQRLQVGAIIVKDNRIISDGFNGTPSGFGNWCEDFINPDTGRIETTTSQEEYDEVVKRGYRLKTKPEVLHAEANAITKIAKSTYSSEGATIYVTHSPCIECAKLIIQSGIKRVVYGESFRLDDGIRLLEKAGIKVEKWS